jgi:hypothetical protein
MRLQGGVISFVVLCAMPLSLATAQTQQQMDWCNGKSGATPDLQISGCTAFIQAGKATGKNLAAGFINRGNAMT